MSKCKKALWVKENNVFVCIDGVPASLKRHRSCILNGVIHTYDSQKELKEIVLKSVIMQIPKDFKPFEIPIEMLIEFHMPIPDSTSNKKRSFMLDAPHAKKPDTSNMIKFYEDVFSGILYTDDKLISKVKASKIYSDEPKTIICVREFQDENICSNLHSYSNLDEI